MRTKLINSALIVFGLLLALLLCEQLTRLLHPAPKLIRFLLGERAGSYQLSSNPILGYELKANFRSQTENCHEVFPYTNAFGFRDVERSLQKPHGKERIILLGDSVAAGHGLCELDSLLSRKLEMLFPSNSAEVLNLGIGGYCTRAEAELLKERGLQFKPDRVVLLFVYNDYLNSNGSIIAQIRQQRPKSAEFLFKHSHIGRWLGLRFNLYGFRDDFDTQARQQRNVEALGDNNVLDGLILLKQLSEQHKFKLDLVLWPFFTDQNMIEPWPNGIRIKNSKLPIKNIAKQLGLQTKSLVRDFQSDFEKRKELRSTNRLASPRWIYTQGDGTHPSELGSEIGAKAIYSGLSR